MMVNDEFSGALSLLFILRLSNSAFISKRTKNRNGQQKFMLVNMEYKNFILYLYRYMVIHISKSFLLDEAKDEALQI